MKAKILCFVFFMFSLLFINTPKTIAAEKLSDSSASFGAILKIQELHDDRVNRLKKYLQHMESPLAPYAETFVSEADQDGLPWYFVPAIAGTESTFAKYEPYNCYNSFGFGIFGTQMLCFHSYAEAIKTVSKTIRNNYINKNKCTTVECIARIYASSPTWEAHTLYFAQQIQLYQPADEAQSLPISL